jgi:hypothetical protein
MAKSNYTEVNKARPQKLSSPQKLQHSLLQPGPKVMATSVVAIHVIF